MDKTAQYARDLSGVEWRKSSYSTVIEEFEPGLSSKFAGGQA